jgi:type II secretory pathway component PulJ
MQIRTQSMRRKRRSQGFMLVDAIVGVMILALGAASFYGLFPVIRRSHVIAREEAQAVQISSRMIEHLQMLSTRDINLETLQHLNLVTKQNEKGEYIFTDVPMDDASLYSPRNVMIDGRGRFKVTELENDSLYIEVIVSWRSPTGRRKRTHSGTVIGGYR